MIYGFLLGNNPELAKDEVISVLRRWRIFWQEVDFSDQVFCISIDGELPKALFFELGGSSRLLRIERAFPSGNFASLSSELLSIITNRLVQMIEEKNLDSQKPPKVSFAISATAYTLPKREIIDLLKEIKKILKRRNLKSRFLIPKTGTVLNAKTLERYRIPQEGEEFFLFHGRGQLILAQTLAAQNIEAWVIRDIGKPSRDLKKGLLPPKLARMMVNLAIDLPISQPVRILDPFCGSGSVLIEALLLGFEAVGLDVDSSQVEASLKNLAYVEQCFGKLPFYSVYKADALKLSQFLSHSLGFFDAIVSEVYLGPPLRKEPALHKQKEWSEILSKNYLCFLKEAKSVLKKEAKLVWALPKWSVFGVSKKILDEISALGYTFIKGYIYHREGQFVSREILVLKNSNT